MPASDGHVARGIASGSVLARPPHSKPDQDPSHTDTACSGHPRRCALVRSDEAGAACHVAARRRRSFCSRSVDTLTRTRPYCVPSSLAAGLTWRMAANGRPNYGWCRQRSPSWRHPRRTRVQAPVFQLRRAHRGNHPIDATRSAVARQLVRPAFRPSSSGSERDAKGFTCAKGSQDVDAAEHRGAGGMVLPYTSSISEGSARQLS